MGNSFLDMINGDYHYAGQDGGGAGHVTHTPQTPKANKDMTGPLSPATMRIGEVDAAIRFINYSLHPDRYTFSRSEIAGGKAHYTRFLSAHPCGDKSRKIVRKMLIDMVDGAHITAPEYINLLRGITLY
ncbi:MAG: hypothetical protein JXK05_09590 [Campylobacterales bacterium]|nr:hypothetical protein [Campylobacterales bacterium]